MRGSLQFENAPIFTMAGTDHTAQYTLAFAPTKVQYISP